LKLEHGSVVMGISQKLEPKLKDYLGLQQRSCHQPDLASTRYVYQSVLKHIWVTGCCYNTAK